MPRWIDLPHPTEPFLVRRLSQLFVGLVAFGVSVALMVRARLGLAPWDVLHQGIAKQTGIRLGWVVIAVSLVVLSLWIPLRQPLGIGTLANAIVVGLSVNGALIVLPQVDQGWVRVVLLATGVILNGVATGLYIGAGLGPGPRDGLMTGVAQRGHSIRSTRTALEVTVLILGWFLGGTVGVGTAVYAIAIGSLAHVFIPRFTFNGGHTDGRAD
ncbi:MAG: hypothetical protein M3290_03080 [Actinomycetota bacterium]|nr:hypothetical protein [Actinomycetota bacterium]